MKSIPLLLFLFIGSLTFLLSEDFSYSIPLKSKKMELSNDDAKNPEGKTDWNKCLLRFDIQKVEH